MPRHKQLRTRVGIGISFTPDDLDWLKATYGKRHSTTDLVRCAIHEAKCWRAGATHPIPPPMAEPAIKGDPIDLGNWRDCVRECDVSDLEPFPLPPGCVQTSLTDSPEDQRQAAIQDIP